MKMESDLKLDTMVLRVLELEVRYLRLKYRGMDTDGGRYNTAADVIQEHIDELRKIL